MKTECIEIIEELLECISWLGGDSYEVECAENMCKNAYDFLEKHKQPEIEKPIESKRFPEYYNIYKSRLSNNIVIAKNKKHAKNLLNVSGPKQVICMATYFDVIKRRTDEINKILIDNGYK